MVSAKRLLFLIFIYFLHVKGTEKKNNQDVPLSGPKPKPHAAEFLKGKQKAQAGRDFHKHDNTDGETSLLVLSYSVQGVFRGQI